MKITCLKLGLLQTNCYVVENDNRNCVVIDPAANFNKIDNFITSNDLKLKAILLTHGHFDHIGAVDELCNKYKCDLYAPRLDKELILNADINGSASFSRNFVSIKSKVSYIDEQTITVEDMKFEPYLMSGHTEGSTVYLLKQGNALFTGDVLFKGGIGRTDLYSGNSRKMMESLKMFKTFDYNLRVFPGHDAFSTIKEELQNNPYL